MAKINVAGSAAVITSTLSLADIKTVEKYRAKELTLWGGEDGKEPLFKVGTTSGNGDINQYGASFGKETLDGSHKACITLAITAFEGDLKEALADKYGAAVMSLSKIEEKIPAVLEAIQAEKAAMMENIFIG